MEHDRSTHLQILSEMMRSMTWQGYRQSMERMEQLGLTVPQVIVLLALKANAGRSTMSALSRTTQQSGATLTGIVDRLTSMELVTRDRDGHDRRVVYVDLTDAGRAKLEAVNLQCEADLKAMTVGFEDAELAELVRLLQKFLSGLGEAGNRQP